MKRIMDASAVEGIRYKGSSSQFIPFNPPVKLSTHREFRPLLVYREPSGETYYN